jgi:hypothetical protein
MLTAATMSAVVRVADGLRCPHCGRQFQPANVEAAGSGWRMLCAGCHEAGIEIEPFGRTQGPN